jgi:hypothetical protein
MATNRVSPKKGKVVDIPDATITIGTPTAGDAQVSVAFTASSPTTGGPVQKYTAISSPGSITGTATTSPVVVSGLTNGTAYTFTVAAGNATGNGIFSSASASATPSVPDIYESIATTTVGSGGADSIEFTSISSAYTHLQLRYIARTSRAETDDGFSIQLNGDTASNYRYHYLAGSGTSVSSYSEANTGYGVPYVSAANAGANTFGVGIFDLLDYRNTNKYKVARIIGGEDNNGGGWVALNSGLWLNTAAVTSIKCQTNTLGNFVQYSHFALYGIRGA